MAEQVELFNGEPLLTVRIIKDKGTTYQWVTKKHAIMRSGSIDFVREFMESYGYQYKFEHYVEPRED